MKICRETPYLSEIRPKYRKIYIKMEVSFVVAGYEFAIKAFSCNTQYLSNVDSYM